MESVLLWAFENLVAVTICGFGSLCIIIRSGINGGYQKSGTNWTPVSIGPRHQLSGIKRAVSKERYQKSGTNCHQIPQDTCLSFLPTLNNLASCQQYCFPNQTIR
jgi:hypothetical protein